MKNKVEKTIREYFGESLIDMEVAIVGGLVECEVLYQNHKTIPIVRKELGERIEYLNNITLERMYSDDVIQAALLTMYNEDMELRLKVDRHLFESFLKEEQ